jgi:hypothetical protein
VGSTLQSLTTITTKRGENCFKPAKKMYESVRIDKGTSINERFHAHLRFYCVKGDAMSIDQWKVLVMFAFLSFNNFPDWQKRIVDLFCESFAKDVTKD